MRLKVSRSKNSESLYVIESIYGDGKRSSRIVEKLGTVEQIKRAHPGRDPYEWAKGYIEGLNEAEKEERREVLVRYRPSKRITRDEVRCFNGGYLFLQRIYYDLKLDRICKDIGSRHKFTFDLNEILSCLVYGRILDPASKLATHKWSKTLLEPASFDCHHSYRALEVLAKEMDFIQSGLYKNSKRMSVRNDSVLYYDCTNFFFEIEDADGDKQYGTSKEHRPGPIVQMGLFTDGDGMPLAFSINPGNTDEQTTLIPLEKKILKDFDHSKFIVCTDAGLSSVANRKFNDTKRRSFVTAQSIKRLKGYLKKWALDPKGWRLAEEGTTYDIAELDEEECRDLVFHKERRINDDGLDQRLVVTYSPKYRNYRRSIRDRQIDRAIKLLDTDPKKISRPRQNDFKRLISQRRITPEGEVADKSVFGIDEARITEEEAYDGFYGVCTNLEDDARTIADINRQRWQIEECFRIMKHEFKARPSFLSRDDRIKAHFMTCFLALTLHRHMEKRLDEKYTCTDIIDGLRSMNFLKVKGEGYIPTYTRIDFTDDLHDVFGFRTDYQIVTTGQMRKNIRLTKK